MGRRLVEFGVELPIVRERIVVLSFELGIRIVVVEFESIVGLGFRWIQLVEPVERFRLAAPVLEQHDVQLVRQREQVEQLRPLRHEDLLGLDANDIDDVDMERLDAFAEIDEWPADLLHSGGRRRARGARRRDVP